MQLKKGRRDVVVESLLVAVGTFLGSIVPSIAALAAWPLNLIGLVNVLLTFGSIVAFVVCLLIARGKANDFDETMADILRGQRCDRFGNVIHIRQAASRHNDDPAQRG